jgi:rod shape-determining protein MreC
MDGLGVVGRIAGTGASTSRVLLLTDPTSKVPIILQPSGQRALLVGDNSTTPLIDFVEAPEFVKAGDRVVTSGDGGLFPPGLLVGQVAVAKDRRYRLIPAADYGRLEFLRVLRGEPGDTIDEALPIDGREDLPPVEEPTEEASTDG